MIINNVNFDTLDPRIGSDKDAEDIRIIFSRRDFIVHTFKDRSADQIRDHLTELTNFQYSRYRCLFIFFLSHGYKCGIYGTKGSCLCVNEIQNYLTAANCPTFRGKPKVLIWQCCRSSVAEAEGEGRDFPRVVERDFFLGFATQPNTFAYRHVYEGSYYIQYILQVIREYGQNEDWLSMFTIVARRMIYAHDIILPPPQKEDFLLDKVYLKE